MRRERGSRDCRLLPPAVALWCSMLTAHLLFGALFQGVGPKAWSDVETSTNEVRWSVIAAVAICGFVLGRKTVLHRAALRRHAAVARIMAMVVIAAVAVGMSSMWAYLLVQWHDPAMVGARMGQPEVVATGRIVEPLKSSSLRDADCQAEVDLSSVRVQGVESRSSARVRVFADKHACGMLSRGAAYSMRGVLSEAEYGATALWLRLGSWQDIVCIRKPPVYERIRAHMQERFFVAASRLSDQGKVLVPGLTMGTLGQDHVSSNGQWVDGLVDEAYATRMEDSFRDAGIMHLMAVSGGHFTLIAMLVRRMCARLLLPRCATACCIALGYGLLASMMAPGDSVSRALIMGWLAAAAMMVGRRPQALSALCCTAIGILLLRPSMATSYGFALSCAAVLGIVTLAGPMTTALAAIMPKPVAAALAMTIAAQLATLPIQVLMEPQIPLLSCVANLLVTPVVSYSTLLGLAALACAWINVDMAFAFACLASAGTRVMEVVARSLADAPCSVLPWKDGIAGALLVLVVELTAGYAVARLTKRANRPCEREGSDTERFTRNPARRMGIWIEDTVRMLGDGRQLAWKETIAQRRSTGRNPCGTPVVQKLSWASPSHGIGAEHDEGINRGGCAAHFLRRRRTRRSRR